jgi:hypothetical protein
MVVKESFFADLNLLTAGLDSNLICFFFVLLELCLCNFVGNSLH